MSYKIDIIPNNEEASNVYKDGDTVVMVKMLAWKITTHEELTKYATTVGVDYIGSPSETSRIRESLEYQGMLVKGGTFIHRSEKIYANFNDWLKTCS